MEGGNLRSCGYRQEVHSELGQYCHEACHGLLNYMQNEEDGVALANACKYGLGAGIWTQDLSRAHRVSEQIEAGLVWVNTHHRNDPSSPWFVDRSY